MDRTSATTPCSSRDREITVCYAVTHGGGWPRRAAASAYSVARHNPGTRIRIAEVDGGDYPEGIWPAVLPGAEVAPSWVLMLDADTWCNGRLADLRRVGQGDVYLRPSSAWTGGKIDRGSWYDVLAHFDLPLGPVYSNGCILCPWHVSEVLRDELPVWQRRIPACGLPDPLMRFRGKPQWNSLRPCKICFAFQRETIPRGKWETRGKKA